ncbi:hypothetical protein CCICO_08125 [Corynebacterium ciconiae DSM 44920]|uniref:hypothetical protein n=1 Tax=Corynebacterium ciconiae TaxID=227319 RepID=UPI000369CCAF|nr:hypothetical protein [Corynebacterium ciconiae]WKD61641.1 hypothetical protein CCICO_08125 [Corynebacterium ciconiae DSM 44920]
MSERSDTELEAQLEVKLAEAEEYVARLRKELAELRARKARARAERAVVEAAEEEMREAEQHSVTDELDKYMQRTAVQWRSVLEFLEDSIAELRRDRENSTGHTPEARISAEDAVLDPVSQPRHDDPEEPPQH